MPDFSSIQQHPDVEEIIDKLLNGTDPKSISDSLKLRYTEDSESHLLISIKLLKEFQLNAGLNMKRIVLPVSKDLSLEHLTSYVEFKTVWHPIGN